MFVSLIFCCVQDERNNGAFLDSHVIRFRPISRFFFYADLIMIMIILNRLKGSMTRLQNIMGVLKRNKVIATGNDMFS